MKTTSFEMVFIIRELYEKAYCIAGYAFCDGAGSECSGG